MFKLPKSTRFVELHAGLWLNRRQLMTTIRQIASSAAYQRGGRGALRPNTLETLDRALHCIGALDAAQA